ncbi:MAG TPA: DUF4340 domain-containing protein [Rhizomicrobium sp.]
MSPSTDIDPRRRNLFLLGVVAVVLIAFAALALYRQEKASAPAPAPETFFPGLAHNIRAVAKIHIASQKGGAFDVVFKPEKGWTLPERGDYPASFEEVRKTINAVATLQTLEPRTARVDWLRYLDLDPPSSGGKGVLITLSDEKGNALASLIAGKPLDIGDASGLTGIFVRKPDSTQSWLARGVLQPASDPAEWVDRTVMEVDRSRIQEVDVFPASGTPYAVRRDKQSDADFHLASVPRGRELLNSQSPDGVAVAAVGFTFDDIKPAQGFNFAAATRVVTRTFDGLTITVQVIADGPDHWARISAEAAPGKPAAEKEARTIDARTDGWAYKLPAYKGQQFMTTLDSLLKPIGAKAKTAP